MDFSELEVQCDVKREQMTNICMDVLKSQPVPPLIFFNVKNQLSLRHNPALDLAFVNLVRPIEVKLERVGLENDSHTSNTVKIETECGASFGDGSVMEPTVILRVKGENEEADCNYRPINEPEFVDVCVQQVEGDSTFTVVAQVEDPIDPLNKSQVAQIEEIEKIPTPSVESRPKNRSSPKGVTHACETCAKVFKTRGELVNHVRTHTLEKPYVCNICAKRFSQSSNHRTHLLMHTEVKAFQCEACGKCFKCKRVLKRHAQTHLPIRPFSCDRCGMSFLRRSQLVTHLHMHTNYRPFVCQVCSKGYATSGRLRIHSRSHTKERPFACRVCLKTFAQRGHLSIHTMKHTGVRPYGCDQCASAFTTKTHLAEHKWVHSNVRPFHCEVCRKGFNQKRNLQNHMAHHVDKKAYADSASAETQALSRSRDSTNSTKVVVEKGFEMQSRLTVYNGTGMEKRVFTLLNGALVGASRMETVLP